MTAQQLNKLVESAITIIANDGIEKGIDYIAEHCNDEWTITTTEHTRIKVMLFQRKRTSIIIDLMLGSVYKTTSKNDFFDTINEIDKKQIEQRKTQETESCNCGIADNDYIGNSELTAGEFRANIRKGGEGRTLEAELERITEVMHIFEEGNMENQMKIQEMQSKGQPITDDFQTEVNRILQLWDLYKEYRDELKHKIFISSKEKPLTEPSESTIIQGVNEKATNQSTGEKTMSAKKEIEKMEEERKQLENDFHLLRNAVIRIDHVLANEIGASHAVATLQEKIETLKADIEKKKELNKKPVRFLMHSVTNGVDKVKVDYSASHDDDMNLTHITIYASSHAGELNKIFPNVINNSDTMTDYFEKDRVKIFPDSPHWTACKAAHDKFQASMKKRKEKRMNR